MPYEMILLLSAEGVEIFLAFSNISFNGMKPRANKTKVTRFLAPAQI